VRDFDLIVVGGGTGRDVVLAAEAAGLTVALVEAGDLGGTCHNRGCMPTKMLIHSADIAEAAHSGPHFGVASTVEGVDLAAMVGRVFGILDAERIERGASLDASELVTWFRAEGRFTEPRTMRVGDETIRGERVVIAAGGRPFVPPIPGLDAVPHLTSDEAMRLTKLPRSLAIIGGGYVATEFAHLFGSLGTEVTIVEMAERLLPVVDCEISEWFTREVSLRYRVHVGASVERVAATHGGIELALAGREPVVAEQLLVATGRRPNSDRLALDAAGIEVDARGQIRIDDAFRTTAEGVWAFGDIAGPLPLKHVAVRQAKHLIRGLIEDDWRPLDYTTMPQAVFASPQVASVGRTEEQLAADGVEYHVGRHEFRHTGMGMALGENGLAKVLASPEGELLGVHIVGPHASILIQEAVVAMTTTGRLDAITDAVHIHPALPQVLEAAANAAAGARPDDVP
jgi:dihydrolipoamide dehydrogenase